MKAQSRYKKIYEVDREGRITIYPSLTETRESRKLKQFIKLLVNRKKPH